MQRVFFEELMCSLNDASIAVNLTLTAWLHVDVEQFAQGYVQTYIFVEKTVLESSIHEMPPLVVHWVGF